MFRLDDELLKELGLIDLPPEEKTKMFNHIYETLEMRVGTRLASQMSDEQLTEFESYIDKNDEAGALKWLETNFPNYKQVVADELDKLKAEIKQVAPQILASALQANNAQPQQPPVDPAQPIQPPQQPPLV
jgi:predicted RNA-binding Zn ribbon-like protein